MAKIKLPEAERGQEWAFRLLIDDRPSYGTTRIKATLRLFRFDRSRDDTNSVWQQEFDGLSIEVYGWESDYGDNRGQRYVSVGPWCVEFDPSGTKLSLDRVEAMAKTLRQIERGLEASEAAAGDAPATFGAFVQRVCRVLGVDLIVEGKLDYHDRWRSGQRYRELSVRDVGPYIDNRLSRWVKGEEKEGAA